MADVLAAALRHLGVTSVFDPAWEIGGRPAVALLAAAVVLLAVAMPARPAAADRADLVRRLLAVAGAGVVAGTSRAMGVATEPDGWTGAALLPVVSALTLGILVGRGGSRAADGTSPSGPGAAVLVLADGRLPRLAATVEFDGVPVSRFAAPLVVGAAAALGWAASRRAPYPPPPAGVAATFPDPLPAGGSR